MLVTVLTLHPVHVWVAVGLIVHYHRWHAAGCSPFAVDPGYVPGMHLPDQMNLERRVNFNELISPSSGTVDTTNVSLYEALKSVIEWTGQVVNGLQTIQWQLLGYETKADGQPDHERPLYSMSNPNPVVNSIVRRYATDTMANLHVSPECLVDCD